VLRVAVFGSAALASLPQGLMVPSFTQLNSYFNNTSLSFFPLLSLPPSFNHLSSTYQEVQGQPKERLLSETSGGGSSSRTTDYRQQLFVPSRGRLDCSCCCLPHHCGRYHSYPITGQAFGVSRQTSGGPRTVVASGRRLFCFGFDRHSNRVSRQAFGRYQAQVLYSKSQSMVRVHTSFV